MMNEDHKMMEIPPSDDTSYYPGPIPHPPEPRLHPPTRRATAYSDRGTVYTVDYRLTKSDGLEYLKCSCPGAEKKYFCRHLKDFISGEFHFYRDMSPHEKARLQKLLPDKENYTFILKSLYTTVIEVLDIEKKLAAIQRDVDEEMDHALRWAIAESKLRRRAGSERRWQYMEAALERVMDRLDLQEEEWGSDLLEQHFELEEERRTLNRQLHRLVPDLTSAYEIYLYAKDTERDSENSSEDSSEMQNE